MVHTYGANARTGLARGVLLWGRNTLDAARGLDEHALSVLLVETGVGPAALPLAFDDAEVGSPAFPRVEPLEVAHDG